jgi:hypothetical protein
VSAVEEQVSAEDAATVTAAPGIPVPRTRPFPAGELPERIAGGGTLVTVIEGPDPALEPSARLAMAAIEIDAPAPRTTEHEKAVDADEAMTQRTSPSPFSI